jgi:hypothetical protein
MFQGGEGRHRPDAEEAATRIQGNSGETPPDVAQTYQAHRLENLRLHHEHQRRATTDGPDRRILMIEKPKRLFERMRFDEFEAGHLSPIQITSEAKAQK